MHKTTGLIFWFTSTPRQSCSINTQHMRLFPRRQRGFLLRTVLHPVNWHMVQTLYFTCSTLIVRAQDFHSHTVLQQPPCDVKCSLWLHIKEH